jgi:hypothetical protein
MRRITDVRSSARTAEKLQREPKYLLSFNVSILRASTHTYLVSRQLPVDSFWPGELERFSSSILAGGDYSSHKERGHSLRKEVPKLPVATAKRSSSEGKRAALRAEGVSLFSRNTSERHFVIVAYITPVTSTITSGLNASAVCNFPRPLALPDCASEQVALVVAKVAAEY